MTSLGEHPTFYDTATQKTEEAHKRTDEAQKPFSARRKGLGVLMWALDAKTEFFLHHENTVTMIFQM
jgi:hypothetical protein